VDIIARDEWGADHGDGFGWAPTPAEGVWLHHTVTVAPDLEPPFDDDAAAVRTLEHIGESRFGGGISYTFVVTPVGLAFEGHSVDRRGAHTKGFNTSHRAIAWVGNYHANRPSDAMVEATAQLLVHGKREGWWKYARLTGGHRDAPGAATTCPGDHADAEIATVNRRAAELEAGASPAPLSAGVKVTVRPPAKTRDSQLLSGGDHGPAVSRWQRKLVADDPDALPRYGTDGDFGDETDAATRAFQASAGIAVDGVVGPNTRTAMAKALAPPAFTFDHRQTIRHGDGGDGGDGADAVREWQRALRRWDADALPRYGTDGDFGAETARWTARAMVDLGLVSVPPARPIVGRRTRAAMAARLS